MVRSRLLALGLGLGLGAVGFSSVKAVRSHVTTATDELDHGPLTPFPLVGEVLTDPLALSIPTEIAVVGAHIVVVDIASDSALHAVSRGSGDVVTSFGRRGSGPGELEGAWSIDPDHNNPAGFWVYDLALKRALFADLDTNLAKPIASDRYVNFLNAGATLTGPVKDHSNRWVSLGLYEDGRFGTFSPTGERLSIAGVVPGPPDAPVLTRQQVYLSTLVAHPNRERFAALTRYANNVELFMPNQNLIEMKEGPLFVDPNPPSRGETRFGYIDGGASHENIFGLFSGRTREGFKDRANFAHFIHVFNWSGELVQVFELDHDALAVAVDRHGRDLYTLRHDPFPAIMHHRLPVSFEKLAVAPVTEQSELKN